MKWRKIRNLSLAMWSLLFCEVVTAQQANRFPSLAPPSGPAPRMADGKPDFSGLWLQPKTVERGALEMLPSAASIFRQRVETNLKDSPSARCLPMGVFLLGPILNKVVQTSALLVVLQEVT